MGASTRRSCVLTSGVSPGGVTVIPTRPAAPVGREPPDNPSIGITRASRRSRSTPDPLVDFGAGRATSTTPRPRRCGPRRSTAMAPFLRGTFGNPSGATRRPARPKTALEEAREEVAELLGAAPRRGRVHRRRHRGRQPRGEGRGPRRPCRRPRRRRRHHRVRAQGRARLVRPARAEGFRVAAWRVAGESGVVDLDALVAEARRPHGAWCR